MSESLKARVSKWPSTFQVIPPAHIALRQPLELRRHFFCGVFPPASGNETSNNSKRKHNCCNDDADDSPQHISLASVGGHLFVLAAVIPPKFFVFVWLNLLPLPKCKDDKCQRRQEDDSANPLGHHGMRLSWR
jgi:hypothetical protein